MFPDRRQKEEAFISDLRTGTIPSTRRENRIDTIAGIEILVESVKEDVTSTPFPASGPSLSGERTGLENPTKRKDLVFLRKVNPIRMDLVRISQEDTGIPNPKMGWVNEVLSGRRVKGRVLGAARTLRTSGKNRMCDRTKKRNERSSKSLLF